MKRTLALIALATACGPTRAHAQSRPAGQEATPLVIRPAVEPRPALKYRLVPERRTLVAGNAALFYHRAIESVIDKRGRSSVEAGRTPGAQTESPEERIANWVSGPIAKVPREDARKQLEIFESVLHEVELGATRASCDWEFDRRQEGIRLLLREIQEMRAVARIVALRARLAILDGKTDEALHWIETGLVVGRHVGDGPIVIQALVGIAIDMTIVRCLEDAIQAPGTASLYWALADRPRPFIDMRYPMEGERYLLEKELPGLDQLQRGAWSLDEARRFADELQRKLFSFNSGAPAGDGPNGMPSFTRRLGIAAMASKIYPAAKKALIEQGHKAGEVEAMPVIQVALLYTLREYERARDDTYKWMQVPYWQSYDRMDRSVMRAVEEKLANPLLALFETLMPAIRAARLASLRLDRQLDALQCVEAIRLHAALHGGKLPGSLDAIKDAPVPLDPITGKPFEYTVDGDSAVLFAPVPPGYAVPQYAIRYALKLAD
jgi:hypothetical protein